MRSHRWILALLALTACDSGAQRDPAVHGGAPVVATREPGAARSAETADPGVLAEILDHVPSASPRRPTGPDGGTLVGTDSGVEGEELPEAPPADERPPLRVGRERYDPLLSNPAIERAARAQIYWPLRQCKTPDGEPPPPESVALSFTLRPDGTVDPATVSAKAKNKALQPVAECVVRTFSTIVFRGPAAAHGTSPRVVVVWPSVD